MIIHEFEVFRKLYGGRKRGHDTELKVLQKHKDWREVILLLIDAVETELVWRQEAKAAGMFVPPWKNMQTWLNQRCWEQEFEEITHDKSSKKQYESKTDERNEYARSILSVPPSQRQ